MTHSFIDPIVDPLIDGEPCLSVVLNGYMFTRVTTSKPEIYDVFSLENKVVARVTLIGTELIVTVPTGHVDKVIHTEIINGVNGAFTTLEQIVGVLTRMAIVVSDYYQQEIGKKEPEIFHPSDY